MNRQAVERNPLRRLLLESPGPNGRPLFRSALELASAITQLPDTTYQSTRPNSLATFLSQIFREGPERRRCPEKLQSALHIALRRRLEGESSEVQDKWARALSDATNEHVVQSNRHAQIRKRGGSSKQSEKLFGELLRDAEHAEEHFVVTPKTVEQTGSAPGAKALRELLVRKLGLFDANGEPPTPQTRYVFLLPGEEAALTFWKALFKQIVLDNPLGSDLAPADASAKLTALDNSRRLQLYAVPKHVCGCPIVVFDPERLDYHVGYSFSFDEDNLPRVIKWDSATIELWKANVFWSYEGLNKIRVRWSDTLTHSDIQAYLAQDVKPVMT